MAIMPALIFNGKSARHCRKKPVTPEIKVKPILLARHVIIDGVNCFLGVMDPVSANPHPGMSVVCPRCGQFHQMRTVQDIRCLNEYTYVCDTCLKEY